MASFSRYLAHQNLCTSIHGYWFLRAAQTDHVIELVPDGYPEIIFTRQGSLQYRLYDQATWQTFQSAGILGQLSRQFQIRISANSEILFVKLYPWAAHYILEIPMFLLNNRITELESITAKQEWRRLARRIQSADSPVACLPLLDHFFLHNNSNCGGAPPLLHYSIQNIFRNKGTVPLHDLSGRVRLSNRYLQQLFKQQLGISPKLYSRIIRVKKASIQMLDPAQNNPLVQIAAELGYFDQSHFLKDFKSIVGTSPSRFLQEGRGVMEEDLAQYLEQWDYS